MTEDLTALQAKIKARYEAAKALHDACQCPQCNGLECPLAKAHRIARVTYRLACPPEAQ